MKIGVYRKCFEEIELSEHPIYKIGAVIFKGGKIFSSGHNCFRSSNIPDKYKKYFHTLHAEQSAIYSTSNWENLKDTSILVIRVNCSGNLSRSFPCKYCLDTIKLVGIKNIYFSDRDGKIKREKV